MEAIPQTWALYIFEIALGTGASEVPPKNLDCTYIYIDRLQIWNA